ncbi:hypothetical protein [Nitrospirillum viridazoti]|uniref:Uncharacterized protein n=1 Tax=Nitrospirillum amazonense TaxID=28077 RepID=A0A560HNW1_9PROT|nr:hypothetical protein [Nitrospirillum amazonense]TWB48242.1 hypothetical protein FBZ92_13026 [Nitrospirillum amazonense]
MAAANLSAATDPPAQQAEADLDRQLAQGAHQIVMDATGRRIDRASFPVGRVPSGTTLVQFWHLDFPMAGHGVSYDDPAVQHLLQEMLAVRRLDAGGLTALLSRMRSTLTEAYGPAQGGMMAAMLMARAHQAIERPEDFPGLLSDAELAEAYKTAGDVATGFKWGGWAVTAFAGAPTQAKKAVGASWAPSWLQSVAQALTRLSAWPVTLNVAFANRMMGMGQAYNERHLSLYRDELNRRNLAIPQ